MCLVISSSILLFQTSDRCGAGRVSRLGVLENRKETQTVRVDKGFGGFNKGRKLCFISADVFERGAVSAANAVRKETA